MFSLHKFTITLKKGHKTSSLLYSRFWAAQQEKFISSGYKRKKSENAIDYHAGGLPKEDQE
jgi:hypothetical protein